MAIVYRLRGGEFRPEIGPPDVDLYWQLKRSGVWDAQRATPADQIAELAAYNASCTPCVEAGVRGRSGSGKRPVERRSRPQRGLRG